MPADASARSVDASARLTSLDGLRGVAALVVMLYHGTKIMAPSLGAAGGSLFEALSTSPLKLLFAGTEAVLVFFALSGLVVALPAFRPGFSWAGYFGSRLVRLYLPVWAALLFAAALIVLIPRDPAAAVSGSWLQTANAVTVTPTALASEATLMRPSYDIDNVLWSLRWEVIFSVALPLFVLAAVAVRRFAAVAVAVCIGISVVGRLVDIDALVYLPVFLGGTVLASRLADLQSWGARRSRVFWLVVGVGSATALISDWLGRGLVPPESVGGRVLWGLAALGAIGLVLTAVGAARAGHVLATRVPRWLGRVSFSLYLVHVPVLATLAFAWGEAAWPWVLVVGLPLSLLVAELFTRLVEGPSHRLARVVRRWLGGVVAPRPVVHEPSAR